ncbi:hypothetical protein ACJDU8_08820 [Clostridium sp. WILCCON 0269]|uniref:CARDB domain-containing protein n=1 Tax=Candidatus Clostridium eludens TaxID=3381663 RepID=A0ABW8SIZ1_9CLOT
MISIIKTAIITIIISFISGLLLDYYKNLAPRILCNIGNAIPMEINSKKIRAYIITVSNISNKIIHELTLNIQSPQNNLRITDAKITKGLKFDSSIKDSILDIYIPFLGKGDKFSVTLYVENQHGVYNKPVITIRSPENFKEIDSVEQNGILALLFNIPKNINEIILNRTKKTKTMVPNKKDDFTIVMDKVSRTEKTINKRNRKVPNRNKRPSKSKKAIITIVSIILVMIAGVLVKSYFKRIPTNTQTPDIKTTVQEQSTDATGSSGKNTSTGRTTKNGNAKTSTDENTKNTNTSTDGTTKNTDTKTSTDGNTQNTDTKTSTDGTTDNTDKNTSTDETTKNADENTSTDGTTKNTDTNTSTNGTTGNTNTSTGGTTENTGN